MRVRVDPESFCVTGESQTQGTDGAAALGEQ